MSHCWERDKPCWDTNSSKACGMHKISFLLTLGWRRLSWELQPVTGTAWISWRREGRQQDLQQPVKEMRLFDYRGQDKKREKNPLSCSEQKMGHEQGVGGTECPAGVKPQQNPACSDLHLCLRPASWLLFPLLGGDIAAQSGIFGMLFYFICTEALFILFHLTAVLDHFTLLEAWSDLKCGL